jgi:hypothetical protein
MKTADVFFSEKRQTIICSAVNVPKNTRTAAANTMPALPQTINYEKVPK